MDNKKSRFIKIYEKYMGIMGPLGNLMFYLQAYNIFTTKSSGPISFAGFLMSFIGLTSWLFYGIVLKNKPLIISNGFGVIGAALVLIGILVY